MDPAPPTSQKPPSSGFRLRRLPSPTRANQLLEWSIEGLLLLAGLFSIAITLGIVGLLVYESFHFFRQVSPAEFLFSTTWSVGYQDAKYGILPLVCGTLVTTGVALMVALPIGTIVAIYLSEYAPFALREILKPLLELLSAVPTVIYGYFALMFVTPLMKRFLPGLGLVMGIMIIPFVSSMADDSIAAVPQALRDGSLAMGATTSETIAKVIVPAALPGIVAGVMLAISRAIGETMIVVMAAGATARLTANPFESMTTVTFQIVAMLTGEGSFDHPATLSAFALGFVLFLVTLALNFIALRVVKRFREAYE